MTANQQEFQRQTELHCNTVNIVNTIINQNQEEVSSSSKIHEDNTELFVTDKNETKVMEELFDKLVAEESTPGLDKLVRSRSFDAVEKWLQNSSSHQDQTAGTIDYKLLFCSSHFWFLVDFGDKVTRIQKYYLIFCGRHVIRKAI